MSEDDVFYGLEETIKKILRAKPELTRDEIFKKFEEKRTETGHLLNLEGAAFLVAYDLGIALDKTQIDTRMKINDLMTNLRDITIIVRVLIVYPVTEFNRQDGSPGKLQRLFIGDESGTADVCVWSDNVDELLKQEIKVNSTVKFEHAYSKESLNGQFELHMGDRGRILNIQDTETHLPEKNDFIKKVQDAKKDLKNFNFVGNITSISPVKQFNRTDGEGKVQRLRLIDETGEINLVIWDPKLEEIEPLEIGDKLEVMKGSIKENMYGALEVHAGKRSMLTILAKEAKNNDFSESQLKTISNISPGLKGVTLECTLVNNFGVKNVQLKDGSTVKLTELILEDNTGKIKLTAWREHAEILSKFPPGTKIRLKHLTSKLGFRNNVELTTHNSTIIELIPVG